jgi:VanZ family protein
MKIVVPPWLARVGFWIPFAIATTAAFSPSGVPLPFRVSDIVLHLFAFTYLTAALWFAHYPRGPAWTSAAWMLAYGVAIEVVQSFEPTRSAELKDFAVDIAGIALGLAVYRGVVPRVIMTGV